MFERDQMARNLIFLDFTGLNKDQKDELLEIINPLIRNTFVEFPWNDDVKVDPLSEEAFQKVRSSGLNVYAPSFTSNLLPKEDMPDGTPIPSIDLISREYKKDHWRDSQLSEESVSPKNASPFVESAFGPGIRLLRRQVTLPSQTLAAVQPLVSSYSTATQHQTFQSSKSRASVLVQPKFSTEISTPAQSLESSSSQPSVCTESLEPSLSHPLQPPPSVQTLESSSQPFAPALESLSFVPASEQFAKSKSVESSVPLLNDIDVVLLSKISAMSVETDSRSLCKSTIPSHSASGEENTNHLVKLDITNHKPSYSQSEFPVLTASPVLCNGASKQPLNSMYANSQLIHQRAPFPQKECSSGDYHNSSQNIFAHENSSSSRMNDYEVADKPMPFDASNENIDLKSAAAYIVNKKNIKVSDDMFNLIPASAPYIVEKKADDLKAALVCTSSNSTQIDNKKSKGQKLSSNYVPADVVHAVNKKANIQKLMPDFVPTPVSDKLSGKPSSCWSTSSKLRSFADVLRNKENVQLTGLSSGAVGSRTNGCGDMTNCLDNSNEISSVEDDTFAIDLGRYFHGVILEFSPVSLQPRGFINSGNLCYMNASIQALLACPPFYRLLRNLPVELGTKRGKSSTPILDNMVTLAREFTYMPHSTEGFKRGSPFQPEKIYDQIGLWKAECLRGQQEDAEEFLSYILNGIHGEVVSLMKHYESKTNTKSVDSDELNNDHIEFDDEEWQVMGANRRGIITRKVVESKSIISDLVGGEFQTFLTTNGKTTTSASVQPFFTLQLDIQANHVTSLEKALSQLTVREPVQGYTCSKTNQEVEAYSKIFIHKLPPVLIFHLKRFVYNPNGGCKKLSKCTQYPKTLDIKKDLLSPDVRKTKRSSLYNLFAVMYHDGEEAIKGHYLTDVYNHGNNTWIRCDDRNVFPIAEGQVLSQKPPRVPYLLFYQAVKPQCDNR